MLQEVDKLLGKVKELEMLLNKEVKSKDDFQTKYK